ncbi:hypothetical protein ABGB12_34055 [Actinocorallia sp. B10E7]|uniref:hypothetical protein n=1 Tax=Actinocorallia sp. B10E7 TaxID=3153558 RepID=UPI00325DA8F1
MPIAQRTTTVVEQPGPESQNQEPFGQVRRTRSGALSPVGAPQIIAVAAATTVTVVSGVTAFWALGDGGNVNASASASSSAVASASGESRVGGLERPPVLERPTVRGWKVVINPKWGTAFDVPPDWEVGPPDSLIGFTDDGAEDSTTPIILMSAPARLKKDWCISDEGKDGLMDYTWLAAAGTKGAIGGKSTGEIASFQVVQWVYGGYTQPDKKSITYDKVAKPYTTESGIRGSIAWARSKGTPQRGPCASDGKAITFGFKNSAGAFVAWSLYCARGVKDELPDSTIMKILSTVRLHGDPTGS